MPIPAKVRAGLFAIAVVLGPAGTAAASSYSDFNAGIAAFKRDDFDGALLHLNAALAAPDLNPAFRPAAYFDRARVYAVRKQWNNAIADFGAALTADPLYLDAYEARAECYAFTGQFDLGVADITALIKQQPSLPRNYAKRGYLYMAQDKVDAAIADFTQAIAIAPDDASLYAARASVYRHQNDLAKATDDIDKAIELDSQPLYFVDRAELFQARADYRHAADDLDSAASLVPADMTIVLQQGVVAWKQNNLAKANAYFVKARAATDRNPAPYAALWAAMTGSQSDADNAVVAKISRDKWPGPILNLYFSGATMDQVLKAAAIGDAKAKNNQLCEADFYGGEWYVMHGAADTAKPMLAAAAANCPIDFVERDAAAVALQKLGHP